ncbi:MAG TPA: SDR family NAD(P)-dependent oxidoreductase [Steroidobacteraceae bacterium]|jgi:short-subunit dehydrogenase
MNAAQEDTTRPLGIVTGASSGIGYELARKLIEGGYDVLVTSSDLEKLRAAAERLAEIDPRADVQVIQADLSDPEGVRSLYEAAQSLRRPIELLAANAGVGVYGEFAEQTSLDDEIALINLNVTSQVHLIKLIAKDMVERGGGDILITSSVAGTMPGPRMAVYAASKAFLRSFGQAIRHELKESGVNVTVLMPGPTDTEFFERADMMQAKVAQQSKQDPAEVAEAALRALAEDSDHVVPGLKNKLQVAAAKLMGDEAKTSSHGKQTRPRPPH